MKKKIIITSALFVFIALAVFYSTNGQLFQGTFIQSPAAEAKGAADRPLARGKFIAMVAKTLMSPKNAYRINHLKNCTPEVKGYGYATYVNFACAKKWKSIRSSTGALDLKNPITKKDAAAILAEVFGVSDFSRLGTDEVLGEEVGKDWLKTAWRKRK